MRSGEWRIHRSLGLCTMLGLAISCGPGRPNGKPLVDSAAAGAGVGLAAGEDCARLMVADPCRQRAEYARPWCPHLQAVAGRCCQSPGLPPAPPPELPGFPILTGCVAGLSVALSTACDCAAPCIDEACQDVRIPSFDVTISNCGSDSLWVDAEPKKRLFLFTRSVETGDIFVPGMPNYEPVTEAWWLPGMVALRPGEQVERLVPMWGVRFGSGEPGDIPEGELQHLGPPPTGWYSVRAVLYLPERGRGTRWPDALWFCEDGSALAECLAPLAAGGARAPDDLCRGAGTVGYLPPRSFLSQLAGFDCVWPLCAPASDPIWTTGALSSNELLVYVDAGPLTADPRLMRHPVDYAEEAAGSGCQDLPAADAPPPPASGPRQGDAVLQGAPAAGPAGIDQRGEEATGRVDWP